MGARCFTVGTEVGKHSPMYGVLAFTATLYKHLLETFGVFAVIVQEAAHLSIGLQPLVAWSRGIGQLACKNAHLTQMIGEPLPSLTGVTEAFSFGGMCPVRSHALPWSLSAMKSSRPH